MDKKRVPLKTGWYKIPESPAEEGYLIGSRCRSCHEVFFPKRFYCANCCSSDMEEKALSTRGVIDTFTISTMTPPGSVMQAPYALARVKLPEGPRVMTVVADCDLAKLDIGTEVELVISKVKEDEEGNEVMAYMFRPI